MTEKVSDRDLLPSTDYQYGFSDEITPVYTTGKGISEAVVREISALKKGTRMDVGHASRGLSRF